MYEQSLKLLFNETSCLVNYLLPSFVFKYSTQVNPNSIFCIV